MRQTFFKKKKILHGTRRLVTLGLPVPSDLPAAYKSDLFLSMQNLVRDDRKAGEVCPHLQCSVSLSLSPFCHQYWT